jgi:hypothetical protein
MIVTKKQEKKKKKKTFLKKNIHTHMKEEREGAM